VSADFHFEHQCAFASESAEEILRSVPAAPGVFALYGEDPAAAPYLTRAADMRRRMRRLLAPPEALDENGQPILSKRLNLRDRVRSIRYTRTGSEFESTLVLYRASCIVFGAEETRRRLRLHTPYFVRITMSHEHPRVYVTNRLSQRSLPECFGPFPSRAAAERYADAVLDLFLLRRCHEDLAPYAEHPGCVYGEMKKCMEPCKLACTPEQYAAEAERVLAFFRTGGQSLLDAVAAERELASEAMDFETAATLHKQWEKVRAASLLADEIVRPATALRAVVLQTAAPREMTDAGAANAEDRLRTSTAECAVFLLEAGHLCGPERLSTLGVRAVREQTAVGSSLFAQPLMLAAVPLGEPANSVPAVMGDDMPEVPGDTLPLAAPNGAPNAASLSPEDRARAVLAALAEKVHAAGPANTAELCDALSLFRRWYFRPEKQRAGEVFLPGASTKEGNGSWPIRRILNGAARVVLGPPAAVAPVDRDAAREATKAVKTKVIHAGREGVEREVPVLPTRSRGRKAITPSTTVAANEVL
jgi:excinuclease ABC subunit C